MIGISNDCSSIGKESACNTGDPGSIPGSGRSPGEGNGSPLQHSCLENPMDGGAWQATVHGVTKSQTLLSNFTFISFPQLFSGLESISQTFGFLLETQENQMHFRDWTVRGQRLQTFLVIESESVVAQS